MSARRPSPFPARLKAEGADLEAMLTTATEAEIAAMLLQAAHLGHRAFGLSRDPNLWAVSALAAAVGIELAARHGEDPEILNTASPVMNRLLVKAFRGVE